MEKAYLTMKNSGASSITLDYRSRCRSGNRNTCNRERSKITQT